MGFFDNMGDRPITSAEWKTYQISGTIADDANALAVGTFLMGSGRGWVDDFLLEVREKDDTWQAVPIPNANFEEGDSGSAPEGWRGNGHGYNFRVAAEGTGRSALIETAPIEYAVREPLFASHPKPGEVVHKSIGSGLSIQLPLAFYGTDEQTAVAAEPQQLAQLITALEVIDLDMLSLEDEDLRFADIVIAWNVLQHFYPYFDVVDADWDEVLVTTLADAADDTDAHDFIRTLRRMLAKLEDGHAGVTHPYNQNFAVLPLLAELIEDRIVVVATEDTSSLQIGDVILSIDGVPAEKKLADNMQYSSGSTQWRERRALSEIWVGEKGSTAILRVLRAGKEVEIMATHDFAGRLSERRPADFTEVEPGIFYVNLTTTPVAEIDARMDDLSTAAGVIFDLRGYPNGNHAILQHLTDHPLQSARWQVPQIIYPDQEHLVGYDTTGRWTLPPKEPRITGAVVFLTNGQAISYAESVMGIVEHYRLGEIIGQPTAGTNGNVNAVSLPGELVVRFTGMRVLKHDGSQHHLIGIQPTIPLERTLAALESGRDEYIEKAVEVIRSKAQK
jgi:C-terminal processing protease CtpA/Prc